MAYQVLARKWRPKSFEELVGQEHVVRALTHALDENRLHHAYLLTGTRGVGKTTLARILAKALNCEKGISSHPCGVCSSCVEISQGRFVDLLEVDAATNTRVEEMRTLLENAIYAPTRGRFKVYVIDEVHMLSTAAFNAMLKTLEEPPEHVKFILATTDPQKIPVTVLSRCLQFNLKQMTLADTVFQIKRILNAEHIPFEEKALPLIARAGQGSMRDALSLLDQAIAFGSGEIKTQWVAQMLGAVDRDFLFHILQALSEENVEQLLNIAGNLNARAIAFSSVLQELGLLLTRLQVLQLAPKSFEDDPEIENLRLYAHQFPPEWIQLAYQIVNIGRDELALAPDEESGFLMTLLRLHAFRPSESLQNNVAPQPGASALQTSHSASPATMNSALPKNKYGASAILKMLKEESEPRMKASQVEKNEKKSALTADSETSKKETTALSPENETRALSVEAVSSENWPNVVEKLVVQGIALQLARNTQALAISNQKVKLRLAEQLDTLLIAQKTLECALQRYFHNEQLQLSVEIGEPTQPTIEALSRQKKKAAQEQTQQNLKNDAFIQKAMDELNARIDWDTVRALE